MMFLRNILMFLASGLVTISLLPSTAHAQVPNSDVVAIDSSLNTQDYFFIEADSFFAAYVVKGKVDYAGIKKQPQMLKNLCSAISEMDLSAADKNTKMAFYINAYNLLTIQTIVEAYPVAGPLDIKGCFDAKKHSVAGVTITLNELENKYLRPDARVHFCLVCAAKGCPKLQSNAFKPETVQEQMDAATKKALNDPQFLRADYANKTVMVSKIFDWYKDDFIAQSGSVIAFINTYKDTKISANSTLQYYDYDWSLNKQ